VTTSIFGLCKVVGLPVPIRGGVQEYTLEAFKSVDDDCSGEIEYKEFACWVKESDEI